VTTNGRTTVGQHTRKHSASQRGGKNARASGGIAFLSNRAPVYCCHSALTIGTVQQPCGKIAALNCGRMQLAFRLQCMLVMLAYFTHVPTTTVCASVMVKLLLPAVNAARCCVRSRLSVCLSLYNALTSESLELQKVHFLSCGYTFRIYLGQVSMSRSRRVKVKVREHKSASVYPCRGWVCLRLKCNLLANFTRTYRLHDCLALGLYKVYDLIRRTHTLTGSRIRAFD